MRVKQGDRAGRITLRNYAFLWWELSLLSWRRVPSLCMLQVGSYAAGVMATSGAAIALRAALNAAMYHKVGTCVLFASVFAFLGYVTTVCATVRSRIQISLIDQVALLDVHPRIHFDIADAEGIEHLERDDYLDRMTIVRTSAWGLVSGFWNSIGAFFGIVQIVVFLFLLDGISLWLMPLLIFAAVPLWFDRVAKRIVSKSERYHAELSRLQGDLFDLGTSPAHLKEIRVSGAVAALVAQQQTAWDHSVIGRYRAHARAAAWRTVGWLLFTLGFGAELALVTAQAANGRSPAGDVVLFLSVAVSLRVGLQTVVRQSASANSGSRLVPPYLWLRDYAEQDRNRAVGTVPPPGELQAGIVWENVSFTYPGTQRPALDNVSFQIPAGSLVAVVGEYGSGKTTLAKLLTKLYQPSSGTIRVDGADLADIDTSRWRSRISASFQDFARFETTLAENVGLGDLTAMTDNQRIAAAISQADATSVVRALPRGTGTRIGKHLAGVDLSEGQWQKVSLARSFMRRRALLLIMDEPTASLDAQSERHIFERFIRHACELGRETGAITIVVSHRFSAIQDADLILVLDKGMLVQSGSHDDLLGDNENIYANLYRLQAEAYT
jgi:ABC-type multidrug transport system fused ATPase/permease subunit